MAPASPAPAGAVTRMVPAPGGRLHLSDHPGQDPPLVLLHGFPDDARIYDRLAPLLAPRRAVAIDWLGYGRSDRVQPDPADPTPHHQQQLGAVLDGLGLDRVVLVGHDVSRRPGSTMPNRDVTWFGPARQVKRMSGAAGPSVCTSEMSARMLGQPSTSARVAHTRAGGASIAISPAACVGARSSTRPCAT
jgi:hypothetical protein